MCNLDKDLLYSYADETIGELERIFVEEHLKYCTECQQELKKIKGFDDKLETLDYEDIVIPDRLSVLSELVCENCIAELEKEELGVQYSNYKEGMKLVRDVAKQGYRQIYENPYSRMVEERLNQYTYALKNNAKKFCRKKLAKTRIANNKLIKMLKVV